MKKTQNRSATKRPQKRVTFSHFTQTQRDRMEVLLTNGVLQKDIALVLKVNQSTISRERKRKRKNGHYDADTAQKKARSKRAKASYRGRKVEKDKELKRYVIAGLKAKRSPDEIAGRMREEKQIFYCGKDAIYDWLRSPYGQQYCIYLCTKRYRKRQQKKTSKRDMIPHRAPLSTRPKSGEHAEGDLFVSPTRTGTSVSGALIVVPSAQFLSGSILENRKPHTMTVAVRNIIAQIAIDDITLDNGIENKGHADWGIPTYFADPHAPWQKPHVENNIGLLRKWFLPKGTDLSCITNEQLQECFHILNSKYRKSLGYKNAYEVALVRGIITKIPEIELEYYSLRDCI